MGCTGLSESTFVKMSSCWKSRSAAQLHHKTGLNPNPNRQRRQQQAESNSTKNNASSAVAEFGLKLHVLGCLQPYDIFSFSKFQSIRKSQKFAFCVHAKYEKSHWFIQTHSEGVGGGAIFTENKCVISGYELKQLVLRRFYS